MAKQILTAVIELECPEPALGNDASSDYGHIGQKIDRIGECIKKSLNEEIFGNEILVTKVNVTADAIIF